MFVCDPRVEQTLLKQAARSQPVAVDFGQRLTRREAEVLELMIKGMSNHDIAGHLGLAERTIKGYVMSIFGKMGVRSRTEAVLEALRRGWIDLKDK
jgi:DNA-binding NarL/FixJ family response regulator